MFDFSPIDQIRMHFLHLEIQRICHELHAERIYGHYESRRQMACLLCGKYNFPSEIFIAGKCGHVYCEDCFRGITTRGLNTLCPYDRTSIKPSQSHFQIRCVFNNVNRVICALCENAFTLEDSYRLDTKLFRNDLHSCDDV